MSKHVRESSVVAATLYFLAKQRGHLLPEMLSLTKVFAATNTGVLILLRDKSSALYSFISGKRGRDSVLLSSK